jgi:hypothetical protein
MEASNNGVNPAANELPQGVAPAETGPLQDVAPAANRTTQGVATASNVPVYTAAQRKEKAVIHNTTLTHLIDNTIWWNPDNFTVEENELKLIFGFDPLFSLRTCSVRSMVSLALFPENLRKWSVWRLS